MKAATRHAIARSAADVIARKGFHAASVDEIAEEAGYSVGALYSNFGSKEDLLLAAAEQNSQDWADLFSQLYLQGETAAERAKLIVRAWLQGVADNPGPLLLWVELWAQAVRKGPPLSESLAVRSRAVREVFAGFCRDMIAKDGLSVEESVISELAAFTDAAGLGWAIRRALDPASYPLEMIESVSARWVEALDDVLRRENRRDSDGEHADQGTDVPDQ
jgi:AcrR family transcriptional regulator